MRTALARMPSGASSLESAFMSAMPAARVTELGSLRAPGALAERANVNRTAPRLARSCGSVNRVSRTAAISLSWKSDSQVLSSIVSMEPPEARPALWTTPSMRPQRVTAASTNASRSPARVTSARCASTSPPAARTAASAARRRSSSRPPPPPAAPSATSRVASARPSPSVPPVMRTVLPVSSRSIGHSPRSRGDRRLGQERIRLPLRAQADEPQARPAWVVLGLPVALTVDPVPGGRPGDDRLLGIEGVQVGPRLLVPVPELLAGDCASHRPPDGAGHHHGIGQIEPHDGVGALPHHFANGGVVAVHDPDRRLHRLEDPGLEGVVVERLPPRLVEEGVQLDVRRMQDACQSGCQGRLARSRASDDSDPFDVNAPVWSA